MNILNAVRNDSSSLYWAVWCGQVLKTLTTLEIHSEGRALHDLQDINYKKIIERLEGGDNHGEVLIQYQSESEHYALLRFPFYHALLEFSGSRSLKLETFSYLDDSQEFANKLMALFKPYYAQVKEDTELAEVRISEWGGDGITWNNRTIKCPSWDEIGMNYTTNKPEMERLLKNPDVENRGKLVIIHGPPGCGKTYFLRTMIRALKKRFIPWIVSDPEELSRNARYYYGMVGDENSGTVNKDSMIVMEDCADLLIEESRSVHFDKIGKLLNMTDGIMGQGRNDLFVITFNENIGEIDAAFRRPGRCNTIIEIGKFEPDDAALWLRRKGFGGKVPFDKVSLAEMYALLKQPDGRPDEKKAKVGF